MPTGTTRSTVTEFKPPMRLVAIAVGMVVFAVMAFVVLRVILDRAVG